MTNTLYSEQASVYDAVSNDRDFASELAALGVSSEASEDKCLLELFAGPAYHGVTLSKSGWQGDLLAVDSSSQMRDVAIEKGFQKPQNYIVADICDAFDVIPTETRFSTVLVMRWSVGLIPPEKAAIMVRRVSERLRPGGCAFFELHRVDLLVGNLSDLDIRTRETNIGDSRVTCIWPSGELSWAADDWKVEMPVLIRTEGPSGVKEIVTSSEEWIYVRRDFASWTTDLRVAIERESPIIEDQFPHSNVVCLRKL